MYYKIKTIYPDIADADFELTDNSDGNGPFISRWDDPRPQPTPEEMEAVDATAYKASLAWLAEMAAHDAQGITRDIENIIDIIDADQFHAGHFVVEPGMVVPQVTYADDSDFES